MSLLRRATAATGITVGLLLTNGGCNDAASKRRIAMRNENLRELSEDFRYSEQHRAARCREAFETLENWWQSDSRRFKQRLPTVGDYIW